MKTLQIPRRFVTHPWGGTETVVLETSKRLIAGGNDTEIWTSQALSAEPRESIEGATVRRFRHFYPYFGLSQEAIKALDQKGGNLFSFTLRRALLREPGVELLHLHTGKRMGGIVRSVARARKIPYVVSLHGGLLDVPVAESKAWTEPTQGKLEWGKLLGAWVGARSVMEDASAILCLGRAEAEAVRARYPSARVEILPNGVDPSLTERADGEKWRQENGIPADAPLVLVVGRIDPQKDQLAAVRALKLMPGVFLALIGGVTNEPYYEEVRKAIGSLGLSDRVKLLPGYPRGDRRLWDAYAAADVVALPSRHEPFGIVVLEAWASEKPVVATCAGGLRDLVTHGHDGLLVPPGDYVELADALHALLNLPSNFGEAGKRKVIESYTWDAVTARLLNLYREVVDAHSVCS